MDVEYNNNYHAEYILPCAVNILSEDDIIIKFDNINIEVSVVVYLLIGLYVFNYF